MGDAVDLAALDRDVCRAASRVETRDAWLRSADAATRERARAFDPFDGVRHVAGQSTYRALVELEPSANDVPLRDALLRWVHELLQSRVAHDLALAEGEALFALDARAEPRRARQAREDEKERAAATSDVEPADALLLTYDEAARAIVTAPDASYGSRALERAADLASPVAAVRNEKRERRTEASHRLGLAHPFALASPVELAPLARALLDATEPLAVELQQRARRASSGPWRAASGIQLSFAKDAREGWPAHLTGRWLDDTFRALAPRPFDVGSLPAPLGGATFMRAALQWGVALRTSGVPRGMPFALARDPYPVAAYRYGYAIASAMSGIAFQRKALDLPARLADAQSRRLRTCALLHARALAVRTLLASSPPAPIFEELTARSFGAPLASSLAGAWPTPRVDEPARFRALLDTHAFVHGLVERYDVDWFRNPRSGAHLAGLACGPAFDADPPLEAAPSSIARAFEEALG